MIDAAELERRLLAAIEECSEEANRRRPTLRSRRHTRGASMLPMSAMVNREMGLYVALEIVEELRADAPSTEDEQRVDE